MPGTCAVAPSPDSRTSQSFWASQESVKHLGRSGGPRGPRRPRRTRWACASASSLSSEPNSTRRNPSPSGNRSTSSGCSPFSRMKSTSTLVDALARDRPVLAHHRHVVAGGRGVREAGDDEGPLRLGVDEPDPGAEHDDAGALGADEGLGDVEVLLVEQLRQVVAGDPSRDLREPGADRGEVAVAHVAQGGEDPTALATLLDGRVQLVVGHRPDGEAGAAVGEHLELEHLVGGERAGAVELGHHRVGAAGVVADHPAEGVAVVRRGVGAVGEAVLGGGVAQPVEGAAGLDPRRAVLGVDRLDRGEVLGEVDDDPDVARLAGQAGAPAAAGQRHAVLTARGDRRHDVVEGLRHDDTERHLAVVRRVRGVGGPAAVVEAHLPLDPPLERRRERAGGVTVPVGGVGRGDGAHPVPVDGQVGGRHAAPPRGTR